jgi:hypothetical protein
MPNKNPSPTTRFKSGQSGNPNGRPKLPDELKDFRKATVKEFKDAVKIILYATEQYANDILNDENESLLNKTLAQGMLACAKSGDVQKLTYYTDRAFGKPKESVDVNLSRPSILIKRDGTQMQFLSEPLNGEEE